MEINRKIQHGNNRVKGEVSKVRDEVRSEIDSLKDNFKKLDKSYAEIISNDRNTKDKDQSSQTHNNVIKNLAVDPKENSCDTGAVLKAKVETLVKDGLKLTNLNINKAVRKVSLHRDMENTRKPNIIFVEVDNLDNKRAIIKAKAVLRNTNKYRDVFIENNIPREKRMLDFNNRTPCNGAQPGSFSPNHIPDYSVLCWEFETNFDTTNEISSINLSHGAHNSMNQQKNTHVSYDEKNIPNDWMTNNDILNKINMCINNIQCSKGRQFEVDKLYDNFVEILHSEMNDKLESKFKVLNSTNNRKRRIKKPWWNDELTNKWNNVCTAERDYVTCKQGSLKQQLRKHFVDKRKDFDKLTQKASILVPLPGRAG
ncbi:unnamed protein product [Mytilus coruscus]|uniref:Uncharacterized protein n=1 Tax=Mytilus coruscus TaxID=42192 RepID=A0A6J8ATC9_MYTCO|nr:unnamed protein product [Mytilus coruscus]